MKNVYFIRVPTLTHNEKKKPTSLLVGWCQDGTITCKVDEKEAYNEILEQ